MHLGTLWKNMLKTCKCCLQINLKRSSEALWKANEIDKMFLLTSRFFPRRLTLGGIFNNGLLFSLLFSGNFYRGQGLDRGGQSPNGEIPPVPPLGKTLDLMLKDSQSFLG